MQKVEKQTSELDEASQNKTRERSQLELSRVEAALYVSGRPLSLEELCSTLKTRSKSKTRKLARTLIRQYAGRNTALEILELHDEKYVMQLKPGFTKHVKKLVMKPLLTRGPLKTLAYIAYRQPVSQKRVADVRGSHAYPHMKELKERNLVKSKKKGRSTVLTTTEYFADYFNLSHNLSAMKRQLKNVFEQGPETNIE
ncbi:MAG: SMC-Scp complex subunit ScpB [Candidatus Bathyarchaeota archaeon]